MDMGARYGELKQMLEGRQREILNEVQSKIREVRTEAAVMDHKVPDAGDLLAVGVEDDIEFALIQMKAKTLTKVNEALDRLEEGNYGLCSDCGEEIAPRRLRAIPFAVRCGDCEEKKDEVTKNR